MTKEELKQEAEEVARKRWIGYPLKQEIFKQGYFACAEPREKRITELIALINAERERQEKCDDVHLRKIAELEKENAELKEKYVKNITDCDICDTYCNSQLTKAKEIIREFIDWANWQGSNCPDFMSIQDKAEQFLKE